MATVLFSSCRPPRNHPCLCWSNSHRFGNRQWCLPRKWCRRAESQTGLTRDRRDWFVAESAASYNGKPLNALCPQGSRSVFLSGPPPSHRSPFTPARQASCIEKWVPECMTEDTNQDQTSPLRLLLPPPESCLISTSHGFTAATAHDSSPEASSVVFFNRPCFSWSTDESATTAAATTAWAPATGVDSTTNNTAAGFFYNSSSHSCSSSSSSSTRPPSSVSFPSPFNWSSSHASGSQASQSNNNNDSNKPEEWKQLVDELVKEVQAELRAEQQLLCPPRRKRSFDTRDVSPVSSCYFASSEPCSSVEAMPSLYNNQFDTFSPGSNSRSSCSPPFDVPAACKRAKKNSLQQLSHDALAERKKQQNRAAAQRYRSRKTCVLEQERDEIELLEQRNTEMRAEQSRLAEEIKALRARLLPSHA